MKLSIYSVRDVRTQAHHRPFFLQNDAVMKRALIDAVHDENTTFSMHPEDYACYKHGEFDDVTGKFETHEPVHQFNLNELLEPQA
jgi:hypothetical protein